MDLYQCSLSAVFGAIPVLYTIAESLLESLLVSLHESLFTTLHESLIEKA
jgi:hypothetical protein